MKVLHGQGPNEVTAGLVCHQMGNFLSNVMARYDCEIRGFTTTGYTSYEGGKIGLRLEIKVSLIQARAFLAYMETFVLKDM